MLNSEQKALIVKVDKKVKALLAHGGNEITLLVEMLDVMPGIKTMMDLVPKKEIEMYFYEYDGFYHYLKVLENLAQGVEDGKITVPD